MSISLTMESALRTVADKLRPLATYYMRVNHGSNGLQLFYNHYISSPNLSVVINSHQLNVPTSSTLPAKLYIGIMYTGESL